MIKGREANRAAAAAHSTDLLVCFPSRTRLTLMPKPICSPVRPSEQPIIKRSHHQRKRSISRGGVTGAQASPLIWNKTKSSMGSEILLSEPTSPKVTCAGQIKVKPKSSNTNGCRNWQSVMEEIEKIHNDKKQKKRLNWAESLGFKKEIMQFLTCLRTIRFDLRCFGSFSGTDITTEDEEEDDEVEEKENENEEENEDSRTMFSKWFMVMEGEEEINKEMMIEEEEVGLAAPPPPPNALLLMRCRSAPGESWGVRGSKKGGGNSNDEKEEEKIEKGGEILEIKRGQSLRSLMEEEEEKITIKKKKNLIVMRCNKSEYYGMSSDIANETWINVGGLRDSMSRSRSWKR